MHVAGCSIDSLEDQKAFASKLGLRFPLIADESGEVCRAYGVVGEGNALAGRATCVIGEDGTVLRAYPEARSKGHAEQVLTDVKAMEA